MLLCTLTIATNRIFAKEIRADFNGDGKKETCYVETPEIDDEKMECFGECICFIKFSDPNIPAIKIESSINLELSILGDLDGNGTVEIGISPMWFTSCWSSYYIYTYANGKWKYFVKPIPTHCNLLEDLEYTGEKIIEKVPNQKNKYLIKYSEFNDELEIIENKTAIVDGLPLK